MRKTYVIDGNSLLFRSFYALFRPGQPVMTSSKGIPTNALFAFRNMMKKIKSKLGPDDKMIVCFDTGKKSFRAAKLESYKMNRKPLDPLLKAQIPLSRNLLDAMNIFHCEMEGFEGDDLVGSLSKYASELGDDVVLFTSDKDFLQLLNMPNIKVDFLRKGLSDIQVFTKDNIKGQMGIQSDQVIDYKGLAGDPSDNIPGIKGVGGKTALKLLDEYGHLEQIFKGLEDNKSKTAQNILANKEAAIFCRDIATIKTDIDVENFYKEGGVKPADKDKLLAFYNEYDFTKFANELQSEEQEEMSLFSLEGKNNDKKEVAQSDVSISPTLEKLKADLGYIDYINVSCFKDLGFVPLSIIVDNSDTNYHKGEVKGFFFSDGKQSAFISKQEAIADEDFKTWLASVNYKLTYDLKGLDVALDRLGLGRIYNAGFDLLIATYLLDENIGQTIKDCLKYYKKDVSSLKDDERYAFLAQFVASNFSSVIDSLKKDDEYDLFKDLEMPLTLVLTDMEIEGFPLNKKALDAINLEYQRRLTEISNKIHDLVGHDINLNSPQQISSLIYDELKLKKKGRTASSDIKVLNAIADRHPVVPLIILYRKYQKIVSSYTDALGRYIFPDGKVHAIYNQALTSTGRLSMSEPNLQNISIRDEDGKEIRKAFFYQDKNYKFLSLDYSQVELRVLASIADIKELQDIFNSDLDIHSSTASKVFNVPLDKVTPMMRRKAKAVNFGIVYGISPWGLSEQIHVPNDEAARIIASFYASYPGLKEYEDKTIRFAHDNGYVTTLLNRRRYLEGIDSPNRNIQSFSERAAVNATIQGSAADLIKEAMVKIQTLLKDYQTKMVLQIHDELIFKVPENEMNIIKDKIADIMIHALPLKCVLKVDGSYGDTWFDCK
jgi:DNA polymerase-1